MQLDPLAELAGTYGSPFERLSLKHGSASTIVFTVDHLQNLAHRASDGIHFVETRYYRVHLLFLRRSGWSVYFLPGAFLLISGSAFGATAHNTAHDAFMTLSPYTSTREDVARRLGRGPNPRGVGF
jgi:hypothetical protein